ncbi:MAG: hypothetical protein ABSB95_10770 [Dissulfurispiraceae bacterium]|jgi:hypothetical protein
MNKLLLGIILLALAIAVPVATIAGVDIGVGISLPPPLAFTEPPAVVALPDTDDVYVAPDIAADLFFWNGWWWRPWEGRWYRSHYYDRGWGYFNRVPGFYFDVDPGWRGFYGGHNWQGHPWNYERIPHERFQQNWRGWHNNGYWRRQGNWGVKGYQPRAQRERQELRNQRQEQYRQRPEVQRLGQQRQGQQRQPNVRQPQRQQQRQGQHSQPRGGQTQKGSQHQKSQQKPERGKAGHK